MCRCQRSVRGVCEEATHVKNLRILGNEHHDIDDDATERSVILSGSVAADLPVLKRPDAFRGPEIRPECCCFKSLQPRALAHGLTVDVENVPEAAWITQIENGRVYGVDAAEPPTQYARRFRCNIIEPALLAEEAAVTVE